MYYLHATNLVCRDACGVRYPYHGAAIQGYYIFLCASGKVVVMILFVFQWWWWWRWWWWWWW